ncbi:13467_t:CDS:2, partial [Funneliformis caledonium]
MNLKQTRADCKQYQESDFYLRKSKCTCIKSSTNLKLDTSSSQIHLNNDFSPNDFSPNEYDDFSPNNFSPNDDFSSNNFYSNDFSPNDYQFSINDKSYNDSSSDNQDTDEKSIRRLLSSELNRRKQALPTSAVMSSEVWIVESSGKQWRVVGGGDGGGQWV